MIVKSSNAINISIRNLQSVLNYQVRLFCVSTKFYYCLFNED